MSRQIIICGFHRSGTSMSAQALSRAGLFLGERLIEAAPSNPDGHFEDIDTVSLHDRWLAQNDSDWCHVGELPKVDRLKAHSDLSPIISRFDESGRDWGIKDPRACLFLSHWHSALQQPIFVMPYRHYASCAASVRSRQANELLLNPLSDETAICFWQQSDLALRSWLVHNKALLAHKEQYPDQCLLLSQEALVHGVNLIQEVNKQFDLSLDIHVDTGVDIKKANVQQYIELPKVDKALQTELEATWQQLQLVAVTPAQHHAQVNWQSDDTQCVRRLPDELIAQWDRLGIPVQTDSDVRMSHRAGEQLYTAQNDTAQSDTAQSDTAQSDTAQSDTAQSNAAQSNTAQHKPAQSDVGQGVKQIENNTLDLHKAPPKSVIEFVESTDLSQRPQVHAVLVTLQLIEQFEFLALALEKRPGDPFINSLLGVQYLNRDDLTNADACLTKACEEANHSTWFHMGLLREKQDRFADAIQAFEKAISISANPDHCVKLIRTCIDNSDVEKATQHCQSAIQKFPADQRFVSLSADVLCLQNRWEEALELCLNASTNTNDTALLHKGFQILTRLGRSGEAQLLYNKATIVTIKNITNYRYRANDVLEKLSTQEANSLQKVWEKRLAKLKFDDE